MKTFVDIESERAVLGSVLLDEKAVLIAIDMLKAEDFGHPPHRTIFAAMVELARAQKPIDVVHLKTHLEASDRLGDIGGLATIVPLPLSVPTAANVVHYARLVRDRARLRRFADRAEAFAREARQATDAELFLRQAQSELIALTEEHPDDVIPAAVWTRRVMDRLEERDKKRQIPTLLTGFAGWDEMVLLKPSSLVTLAARPSVGKTALAQNLALGAAKRGARVLFISIEMGEDELGDRFTAVEGRVRGGDLERPWLMDDGNWPKIARALGVMSQMGIDIWETAQVAIGEIEIRARRMHALNPVHLIIVDYLQLVSGDQREGRVQEVSSISRGLKRLAKKLRVPVLALSQLSREVEKRKPPIPELSDLRESGSIEQDSDAVAFLYRPTVYDDTADPGEAHVYVRKNRHGPVGRVMLRFDQAYTQFFDPVGGGP